MWNTWTSWAIIITIIFIIVMIMMMMIRWQSCGLPGPAGQRRQSQKIQRRSDRQERDSFPFLWLTWDCFAFVFNSRLFSAFWIWSILANSGFDWQSFLVFLIWDCFPVLYYLITFSQTRYVPMNIWNRFTTINVIIQLLNLEPCQDTKKNGMYRIIEYLQKEMMYVQNNWILKMYTLIEYEKQCKYRIIEY